MHAGQKIELNIALHSDFLTSTSMPHSFFVIPCKTLKLIRYHGIFVFQQTARLIEWVNSNMGNIWVCAHSRMQNLPHPFCTIHQLSGSFSANEFQCHFLGFSLNRKLLYWMLIFRCWILVIFPADLVKWCASLSVTLHNSAACIINRLSLIHSFFLFLAEYFFNSHFAFYF